MERRLAAILFADITGYARLMHRDEAAALAQVDRMRDEVLTPLLAAHGGRLVSRAGDGFLLEFPSPTTGMGRLLNAAPAIDFAPHPASPCCPS